MAQQVGDPRRVLHIRLASWDGLHMLGVDQDDRVVLLKQIENRMPVHPATFERDMRDPVAPQPIGERKQVSGHGQESLAVLLHGPIGSGQHDTGHDRLFVNV